MYEELVKRLRNLSGTDNIVEFDEAADAIEELSVIVRAQKAAFNAYIDKIPKWISVEERLPSVGDKVIVAIRDESGDTRYDYTNTGWYSGNGEKWVVEDEYCSWVTHWMPLPEPLKIDEIQRGDNSQK